MEKKKGNVLGFLFSVVNNSFTLAHNLRSSIYNLYFTFLFSILGVTDTD